MVILTGGADAPEGYFGFVDDKAVTFMRRETGRMAVRAIGIGHRAAGPANDMVMVVADAVLETCRRPGWFDPPQHATVHEHGQRVVDRLPGDRAELCPSQPHHVVRRRVRGRGDRAEHGDALRGHLQAVAAKAVGGVLGHGSYLRAKVGLSQELD